MVCWSAIAPSFYGLLRYYKEDGHPLFRQQSRYHRQYHLDQKDQGQFSRTPCHLHCTRVQWLSSQDISTKKVIMLVLTPTLTGSVKCPMVIQQKLVLRRGLYLPRPPPEPPPDPPFEPPPEFPELPEPLLEPPPEFPELPEPLLEPPFESLLLSLPPPLLELRPSDPTPSPLLISFENCCATLSADPYRVLFMNECCISSISFAW